MKPLLIILAVIITSPLWIAALLAFGMVGWYFEEDMKA